jgi:RNA polymerase sigma-70 factor (ECF subfamily)
MGEPDTGQFVKLLVQHQNELLRFIAPMVGSVTDAQDVLQDTALALWKKFEQYDQEQPFLPWAKQFAKYEVLMYHRRRQRYTFLSETLIEALANRQTEQETVSVQRRRALADCISRLREADRLLLKQRYAEKGTTIQQVAALSGQTANALYKTLQRIRRQLYVCVDRKMASSNT